MTLHNPALSSFEELDALFAPIQEDLLESQKALHENIDSQLPWMAEVLGHIQTSSVPPFRSIVLAFTTRLFSTSAHELPHVASVLEYLNMAATIHQHIVLTEESRRKQETLSSIWGNEASVLLGDYLLAISLKTMTRLGNFELLDTIATTTKSIARGQVLAIAPFSWEKAESHMIEILQNRNASLFWAGAQSGAILGKATPDIQKTLSDYGLNLGLGIQLKDDLAAAQDSKTLQGYLEKRHLFFPLTHLMEQMHRRGETGFLKKLLAQKDFSASHLQTLHAYFQQFQVYDYTHQQIESYLKRSENALTALPHLDVSPLLRLLDYIRLKAKKRVS